MIHSSKLRFYIKFLDKSSTSKQDFKFYIIMLEFGIMNMFDCFVDKVLANTWQVLQ